MDSAALVALAIRTSVCLIVFSLGLGSTQQDAVYLLRRPGLLVRSMLAMNVVMPVAAAALAAPFGLNPAVQITLVALGVSPVPPILPKKAVGAGGRAPYAVSLLMTAALLAIVLVPISLKIIGHLFSSEVAMPAGVVAKIVAITVLAPLAIGIVVRRIAPALAARIARPVSLAAMVLLGIGVLLILLSAWPAAWAMIGSGRVLAILAFIALGLAAGHLLGGPRPEDRTVLALSTASRHPGMALTIAGTLFPEHTLVTGGILLYLLVGFVVTLAYVMWQRRQSAGVASTVES